LRHNKLGPLFTVGGGTAGAVVANRLSANPNFNVLLLEAGGDPTILNSIPGLTPLNMHQDATDWFHRTIPTKQYGHAMENNVKMNLLFSFTGDDIIFFVTLRWVG